MWSTTVLEPGPRAAGQRSLSPERAHGAGGAPVERRGGDGDHGAAGVGQAVPADQAVPEAAERAAAAGPDDQRVTVVAGLLPPAGLAGRTGLIGTGLIGTGAKPTRGLWTADAAGVVTR